jgi:hypothetical protein
MSMKFFIGDNAPVMWRGPMLGKAIRQMMEQTAWHAPRYMVLDLPPGTGDIALDVHDYFPAAAVLVVTTPDRHAAQVAERAGRMAQHLGRSVVGVVENLSSFACPDCGHETHPLGRGGGARVAEALAVPLLAEIPWVAPRDGVPMGLLPTSHPAAAVYRSLAVLSQLSPLQAGTPCPVRASAASPVLPLGPSQGGVILRQLKVAHQPVLDRGAFGHAQAWRPPPRCGEVHHQFEVGQRLHERIQAAGESGRARFPVQQRRQEDRQHAIGRVDPDLLVCPMKHRRKGDKVRVLHLPEAVL